MARKRSLARTLFTLAALLTTWRIIASGQPQRIGRHLLRKQAHKGVARALRKL